MFDRPVSDFVTSPPTQTASRLQAVLFDMDGTLVDTEPYWVEAEYRLVAEFGGTWNDEHADAIVGSALLTSAAYLRDVGGVRLELPVIVDRLVDDVAVAARRHMPWRPGALDLLAECRTVGIPCAMVTMSYERLAATLVADLPPGSFAAVVTGDQVERGKPHPEAYRTACERLGVRPGRAVAIEDSPTGVASAEAAGCVVVAVPHRVPIDPAPGRSILPTLDGVTVADLERLVPG